MGYGIVRNEARLTQNDKIIQQNADILTELKSQAAVNDANRRSADAALLREVKKLFKITEDVQEQTSTQNGVRVVTRTVTRTRTVCIRPNGRPC